MLSCFVASGFCESGISTTPRRYYCAPKNGCIISLPLTGVVAGWGFIIFWSMRITMWLHKHRWSEWQESGMNRHVWSHAKTAYRFCRDCGQEERRVLDVDCTRMKRVGRWCDGCASLLAKSTIGEYIMPTMATRTKRPESGRPARVEFISEVKRRMAEGQTHAQIKKELGIKDFKTLWRIKRYPEERLEKQREYAKIANA